MIGNNYITILYGILVNFVDDMNDYNTAPHLKLGLEIILAILTIYILYFTNSFLNFTDNLFVLAIFC